jgi:drug/metabolite transporter (DMT)-like permease
VQSIPIDWIFWPSLIVLAAGVLALVPIWWKGRRTLQGRMRPVTEEDAFDMRFACILLLGGFMGLVTTALTKASRTMDFGPFMAVCGTIVAFALLIAFVVDTRARRHR